MTGKSDAQRAREYRARKRAEKLAEQGESATDAGGRVSADDAPRLMRDAVEASVAAAKWLKDSDGAAVMLARRLAEHIDVLEARGAIVQALSAHTKLSRALGDLGLTPNVREKQELRSRKLTGQGGDDDDTKRGTNGAALPPNVQPIKRPSRRKREA